MKNYFLICILIVLFSCNKEESELVEVKLYSEFNGNWEYYNEKCTDGSTSNSPLQCHSMEIDINDVVWIGSESCLCTFTNGIQQQITNYDLQSDFYNTISTFTQVTEMYQAKDGNFYIGTNGGLLDYSNNWNNLISDCIIVSFYEDDQSNIWIGTSDGLFKNTSGDIVEIELNNAIPDKSVGSMAIEENGNIWVLSEYGERFIAKYNGVAWERVDSLMDIPANQFSFIYKDSKNNIWFLAYSYGIVNYDGENWVKYDFYIEDFTGVTCCIEDSKGVMWFARENGVLKYENSVWETSIFDDVFVINGFASGSINSIKVDTEDNIWCATYDKGIYKLNVN